MQYVSLLSNHALPEIVQHCRLSMNMQHACLFFEKCDVHSVNVMPSIITIYGADVEIKYSQVIQSYLMQCYHVNKEFLVECFFKRKCKKILILDTYFVVMMST